MRGRGSVPARSGRKLVITGCGGYSGGGALPVSTSWPPQYCTHAIFRHSIMNDLLINNKLLTAESVQRNGAEPHQQCIVTFGGNIYVVYSKKTFLGSYKFSLNNNIHDHNFMRRVRSKLYKFIYVCVIEVASFNRFR